MVTAALKRAEPRTRSHRLEVWVEDLPPVTVDEHANAGGGNFCTKNFVDHYEDRRRQ